MPTVLVTGGTGLIGRHLCQRLKQSGFDVAVLSQVRYNKSEFPVFHWNWKNEEVDEMALRNSDYIVHLAGANIAGQHWTTERKKLIIDSRVKSTQFLQQKLKELNLGPKAFVSASAVGYYGAITTKNIYKETSQPENDFLGTVCQLWEKAASDVFDSRIRTVQIRTGVVLTSKDGAMDKMVLPIKMGVGAALGTGKQYMPWIHIDDLCDIYVKALNDVKMNGAFNAISPEHQTNKSFTKALAKTLGKPMWLPNIPSFILKIMFGEMADMLLYGSRVSSAKILDAGFEFQYPNLDRALADLMKD
tara:strand:- start:38972 stop:39880 length:909 start_codon:yes stop_codon:yes gene_type:complete